MNEPMSKIFFYGLFMDHALLTGKGLHPQVIGPAVLRDYRIQIGERATLLPCGSSCAYGILMELADDEVRSLYAEPSVRDYAPDRVMVELLHTAKVCEADCYNLPSELAIAGASPAYAAKLSELVAALGFDPEYVKEVAEFGQGA